LLLSSKETLLYFGAANAIIYSCDKKYIFYKRYFALSEKMFARNQNKTMIKIVRFLRELFKKN